MPATFKHPGWDDFPQEGFVEAAVREHFAPPRFREEPHPLADLHCVDTQTGQHWVIEAKGRSNDSGGGVRKGLGQLVQRTLEPTWCCALAVPDTHQFRPHLDLVPAWTREALNLHWILVAENGEIEIVEPRT